MKTQIAIIAMIAAFNISTFSACAKLDKANKASTQTQKIDQIIVHPCTRAKPITIDTIGLVGSYADQQNLKYYILTQNSLFILKEEPSDEVFGKIIKFQGIIEKQTGKLQLNAWKEEKASPFRLQLQGTIMYPHPKSKRSTPYFKIDAAFGDESIFFHVHFLNSSHIRIKENTACTIHAQPRVITRSKISKDSDISEIIAMSRIDTNSISLFNVY